MQIFDDRKCELGEGPLWHPEREQLFWFDILNRKLLTRSDAGPAEWVFDRSVSAAGWVDDNILLVASERDLFTFDLRDRTQAPLCALESENTATRSNDGRADPHGGFWIGTMGKRAEKGAGSIWRFYRGELRRLFPGITIPNAQCFSPDGHVGHFADTVTGQVMRVALDSHGWPRGQPEVYLDLRAEDLNPDGAVIDSAGNMWLAEWGAARVACYAPGGERINAVHFDAPHTSCPAFGGPDMTTLFCTTALEHMDPAARAARPHAGKTFSAAGTARGQYEPPVIL
jgi:sugar lactone lactonase YvrE